MDNCQALRIANGHFAGLLRGMGDDGWELATPCSEWNVRDLVRHVVAGHAALVSGLTGEQVVPGEGDTFDEWVARVERVIERPGVLERTVRNKVFGELSGDAAVRVRWSDTYVHVWDLAQALGAEFTPDQALAEAALEWLEPLGPGLSATGQFQAVPDPGPGTDAFTRMLALTGRDASRGV
ncbi:TIGR03086 family metal-binding protein [Streptomyces sp. NPDC005355]|uniref:TIGR03086 family metal-binding protein n=1 Tax=Streptomyces sp. NPDC005355 TaxID=3157038 RepID=UPI00339FABA7